MKIYLARRKIKLSPLTVHKYMNTELQLRSVVRRKKTKWATDFTYLYLSDGSLHYNCSIIDLYERSVLSSLTDSKMTASLAIRTLKDSLRRQPKKLSGLILHSDKGAQFTSHEFTSLWSSVGVIQSMSRLSLRQFSHGTLFQHLKDRTHLSL